ncbi:alpha/beta hydrolase [Nocardiopsis sp. N85]|uniref:alpha/beta fold hydrolase n=1 Tax=Nocardiopsis sp. N85 TaxID=3029400 RepID=UPI00237F2E6C|nr:alpha/beta hydrolase [Nocardiopsis sp. N85]MDE3723666.1 alpha/beta hydrolase [Nocardiopsis sp. N85]
MYVRTFGREGDPPVLLLHGGGVAGWMWDPTRERLGGGLRSIVPDLPGHDRGADEPYRSHARTVEELGALIEKERPGGRVAVVGFSLGAQLAVLLAADRPDLVDRVMVVSAQAVPTPAPGLILGLLGATAGLARREWFARLQAKELFVPESLMADYIRTSSGVSKQTLLAAVGENIRFTVPSGWARFPGTAHVLVGARERRVMRNSGRALHEALPTALLETVEGCGHGVPLQRPEWFAGRLREWLDA